MISTHLLGGRVIRFRIPPTAADILDWKIKIQCVSHVVEDGEDGPVRLEGARAQILLGLRWAAQWVEFDIATSRPADQLGVLIAKWVPEAERFFAVVELCNAICASASLDVEVLDSITAMYDERNSVPKEFKSPPLCPCFRCEMAQHEKVVENPPGEKCLFEEVDPRAVLAVMELARVDSVDEPYYVSQIRGALSRASDRKSSYEEKVKKDEADSDELRRQSGAFGG